MLLLAVAEATKVIPKNIEIGTLESLVGVAVILLTVGAAWGTLKASVKHANKGIDELKKDMKENRESVQNVSLRLATIEGASSGLVKAQSPVGLTEKGKRALELSGLKDYIDSQKDVVVKKCSGSKAMKTPYDIQESAIDFFRHYAFPAPVEEKLKNYAFQAGTTLDSLRLVAGIYFRDICLKERGFDPKELDL